MQTRQTRPFMAVTEQLDDMNYDAHDQISVEHGFQAVLDRDVVIRRLRPAAAANPWIRGRFVREIRALAALHHHNFIRIYDASLDDELPYAIFERLRGITARQRLDLLADRRARMPLDEVIWVVRGVTDGLEYAHRRGVGVYDVTPDNIMLSEDRRVVLTGLGQPLPDDWLSAPAQLLAYTPPERLAGVAGDDGGEVYRLGVLLAHLVFGRLPFEGSPSGIITQKQQAHSLPVLEDPHSSLACPYPLATVMQRATLAEPANRYANVETFRTALLAVLDGHSYKVQLLPAPDARPHRAAEPEVPAPPAVVAEPTRLYPVIGQMPTPIADQVSIRADWGERERAPVVAAARPIQPFDAEPEAPAPTAAALLSQPFDAEPEALEPVTAEEHALPVEAPTFDPLMPGLDRAELLPALPYTVLVPMPEERVPGSGMPGGTPLRQNILTPTHMIVLLVLSFLAVFAAFMFG
jgi:serine/threonine protein kinase